MTELLLPTKLACPQLHSGFVARSRLVEQLNRGLEGKLTLLSAPAGFGKTTLLAEWIDNCEAKRRSEEIASAQPSFPCPQHFAWLSLDENDNDPARFLTYFFAALQKADSTIGEGAVPQLQANQPFPTETILRLLIADLSRLTGKVVLILDDCHLIRDPAVYTALLFLLEHAPRQLHLVVAGRSDPPLALARWRVQGELNEIRAADLRFSPHETSHFLLKALASPLPEVASELLTRRTEGWPAAVQLAALSLRGRDPAAALRFVADFHGSHRHVFTYLTEEILQRQPGFVQQFLLQTTLLDRLTASLCDAVVEIGSADDCRLAASGNGKTPDSAIRAEAKLSSQRILEYLAANNLFLFPLDESGHWFRYHTLFAEAVQTRLRETEPELIPVLQQRAGRWYAENGYTAEAIRHALAAGANAMAADLLEAAADNLWQHGHLGLLLSWLNALPEDVVRKYPGLCLLHGWLFFLHDRWPEASQRIHVAGQLLAALPPDDPQANQQRGRWAAVQGAMAAHRQDVAGAVNWMESALEKLPPDDVHWRQVALIGLGLAQLAEGQACSAISTLHRAAVVCEEVEDIYLAFAAWWHQMEACRAQGRLREAGECLRRLELLVDHDEGHSLSLPANAMIGRGMLAYDRNELEKAEQYLTTGLPQTWPGGQPRIALHAYLTLARLVQAQGEPLQGQKYLDLAAQLVHRFNLTAEKRVVAATAARLLLTSGRVVEAHWQLEKAEIGPQSPPDFQHEMGLLTLVRLYLAEGRADEALTILRRVLPPAELVGRAGSLLEICLLHALALAQQHQHDRALAYLKRALALAEPEQFIRIFIDEGNRLASLLRQITPPTPFVAHLLQQSDGPMAPVLWPEHLTDRELEILKLVAAGASNQLIADQLVISVGTVKGHLNHILGKLDAQNRTQAAARARELGLL